MNFVESQIRLRALQMADLSVVLAWSRDVDFCLANEWTANLTVEHVHRWLSQTCDREFSALVRLGVECDNVLVGYVDLANVTEESAEFGIAIGQSDRWGQGLGTAAGRAIVDKAFNELGLRRLNAVVADSNVRSQRLVARLGFRQSSIESEPPVCPNGPAVSLNFSLTVDEWRIR